MNPRDPAATIRIGISSCLLGEAVRYDGGHKRDAAIIEILGRHFEFVPVCPEVGIGLGVPRAPIRLVGDPQAARAVGVDDPTLDVTDRLTAYGARMAHELDGISGYIFKSRSPSCGVADVEIHQPGLSRATGSGLYARAFMNRQPALPVAEESRLGDAAERENFIGRVLAYRRWQESQSR